MCWNVIINHQQPAADISTQQQPTLQSAAPGSISQPSALTSAVNMTQSAFVKQVHPPAFGACFNVSMLKMLKNNNGTISQKIHQNSFLQGPHNAL